MSQIPEDQSGGNRLGAMEAFGMQNSSSEEKPALRSVAFMPGAPKLTPLSGAPIFGKAPVIGLARPKGGLRTSRQSFTVTQEWTGTVDAAVWNVKCEDLDMVPVDFPLERTHREIKCDAAEVGKRISEFCKKMSIDATYEKSKAKCRTMDCVQFRIRLYAGGEKGQPVVVEVQKRSGSTSSFMRSCRAVLDAAEGCNAKESSQNKKFSPPVNLSGMKCIQTVDIGGPSPEEESRMAFESATSMLKSGKHDSVVLGLESLCNLTDPLKTSAQTAIRVSKWIIFGEENLSKDIMTRFQFTVDQDTEDLALVHDQQKHYALVVFANALEMCATDGCLRTQQSSLEAGLVPALLEVVKDASNNAGNAYTAARSICTLVSSADFSLEEHGGVEVLQVAHKIGLEAHDLLAGEASRCLDVAAKSL